MSPMALICLLSALVALALGVGLLLAGVDHFLVLVYGTLVSALVVVVGLLVLDRHDHRARQQAIDRAQQLCSPYQVDVYVDRDRPLVVFACKNHQQLRVLRYRSWLD